MKILLSIISKIFKSPLLFAVFLSLVILSLNILPLIVYTRHAPPGRTYPLLHNNVQDFYFYISLMNQGSSGSFLTRDPFTTEPHTSSIIFSYFLWLGKIGSTLRIPHILMYNIVRILLGFLALIFSFRLIQKLKVPFSKLAFIFFIFASPLMQTTFLYDKVTTLPYMSWWTGVDAIRRSAYLPHHMFGSLFLVIFLILLINLQKKPKLSTALLMALSSFLLSFIHPPSLFILFLIIPPSILIHKLLNIKNLKITKADIYLGISLFFSFLFMVFMISQTGKGFPWSQYMDWERNNQYHVWKEIFPTLGVLVPFSLIGVLYAFYTRKLVYILSACWLYIPILLLPIAQNLGISDIRLIQGTPYLPLGILSALGIYAVWALFHKIIITYVYSQKQPVLKYKFLSLKNTIITVSLIIFTLFTIQPVKWSLAHSIEEYWPIFGNVYLDNRMYKAIDFLNTKYPKGVKVMTTFYSGNYLPAYSHATSFIGHQGYTNNYQEKEKLSQLFFSQKMTLDEAKKILKNNDITLVFQGPEEKPLTNVYLYPEILNIIYNEPDTTIYEVKK